MCVCARERGGKGRERESIRVRQEGREGKGGREQAEITRVGLMVMGGLLIGNGILRSSPSYNHDPAFT